jgi:cell division septation protein DedD
VAGLERTSPGIARIAAPALTMPEPPPAGDDELRALLAATRAPDAVPGEPDTANPAAAGFRLQVGAFSSRAAACAGGSR